MAIKAVVWPSRVVASPSCNLSSVLFDAHDKCMGSSSVFVIARACDDQCLANKRLEGLAGGLPRGWSLTAHLCSLAASSRARGLQTSI